MANTAKLIYTHIVKEPGCCGGKAQVYPALTYYYDHVEEIEAELAQEGEAAADFERRQAALLAERSRP